MIDPDVPLLRTLSPLLLHLEKSVRGWLDGPHRWPLSMLHRASLEGLAVDLHRKSAALDVEKPLLVIMLMGGTGVGKSTLINAIAGSPIAQSSFTRPTTRDPVVYFHESVSPERLDPALKRCKLAQHNRPELAQKILVDTPDLDSNDLTNRDKLVALLPVADIVLYVGSQEKYHDQLGWVLFREQRQRRAFAFVLNKWDRCLHPGATGLRPDRDLLKDLQNEGFTDPLLFRTTAQTWLDHGANPGRPDDLPEGEQFAELKHWLELGLTRLEIEAVKARGVGQLLSGLQSGLAEVMPPDFAGPAEKTRQVWERLLRDESRDYGDVLLSTLDPYQSEIEHHFSVQSQQRFRGFMAAYMRLTTRFRYAGNLLRDRIPVVGPVLAGPKTRVETPDQWNLAAFAHECTRVAGQKVLDRRGSALVNRLLVEADGAGFPVRLLTESTGEAARLDWQATWDRVLVESMNGAERLFTRPVGIRKYTQVTLSWLANTLPEVAFVGSLIVLLYLYFVETYIPTIASMIAPFVMTLVVMVLLQALTAILLPLRWGAVRSEFQKQMSGRLEEAFMGVYGAIPGDVAGLIAAERAAMADRLRQIDEVQAWLAERENAAGIAGLYGREG